MKTIQMTFGAFVEISHDPHDYDTLTGKLRAVVHARARAFDAQCLGKTESDALNGLAEYYEQLAGSLRNQARLANRQWEVSYAEMPIACNPTKTVTVTAPSADEAVEMIQKGIALPIRVRSVTYVPPTDGGAQ